MRSEAVLPHDSAGGRYLFLCKHNDVSQHGGQPVTIATRRILSGTDSARGQRGQSGRAHSHPRKIREQKGKAGWECETGRQREGTRETRGDKDTQVFKEGERAGERCRCQWWFLFFLCVHFFFVLFCFWTMGKERQKAVRASAGERLKTDKVQSVVFNFFRSDEPLGTGSQGTGKCQQRFTFHFQLKKNKKTKCGATRQGPWQFHQEMLITGLDRD